MKIQLQQLKQHKIAPVYLISGDEFLLVQEACDLVRKLAIDFDYNEREVFHIETGFNWKQFITSTSNASLFGEKTLIELRLNGKIDATDSEVLQNYLNQPSKDKIILIITNKLDAAQQKTKWFKAIDACGLVLQIWPIDASQMSAWIMKRLSQYNLNTNTQGVKILADHACGNLLAVAQEIEKLSLIYGDGSITPEQIINVITDNSKFNVFNLIDTALAGNKSLTLHTLDNLKAEDIEPTIVLWSIARELRVLINMSLGVEQNIWDKRKALFRQALSRHKTNSLQSLLQQTAKIDRIIKGVDNQHILWHEIYNIFLCLASK